MPYNFSIVINPDGTYGEQNRGIGCPDCEHYDIRAGRCEMDIHNNEKYLYTATVWCNDFDLIPEIIG